MHSIDKIGPRIRSLREARGYSQEYMADMLHITQPSYAHIESGKTSMKVDRLFRIAEILHVNVIDLLEEHQNTVDAKNLATDVNPAYDQLIREMKDEIIFLRSLIRNSPGIQM